MDDVIEGMEQSKNVIELALILTNILGKPHTIVRITLYRKLKLPAFKRLICYTTYIFLSFLENRCQMKASIKLEGAMKYGHTHVMFQTYHKTLNC